MARISKVNWINKVLFSVVLILFWATVFLIGTFNLTNAQTTAYKFVRGDVDGDGLLTIGDAIFTLNYLFANGQQPSCLDVADINDDGQLDIGDPIRLLNYLFSGGPSPEPPFPDPGEDPTEDSLFCITDTTPPLITKINLPEGLILYVNDAIIISTTVQDNDPSPLEYQFSIDQEIKQVWSSSSTYTWVASTNGVHTLTIEVRDLGGQDSRTVEVYVYRRPIEPPKSKLKYRKGVK